MTKVVLTCDQLIVRNWSTAIFECFLEYFEFAEIYTLVHQPKKVLGPTELRRIHASYLSRMVNSIEDLFKWSMLIPGAAGGLPITCTADTIINISSGLSHGIKKCKNSKQITYLIDELPWRQEVSFLRDRLFRARLKKWSLDQLSQVEELWVTNSTAADFYSKYVKHVEVLPPFFKNYEYPLFPSSQREKFPHDFVTIEATDLPLNRARELIEMLQHQNIKFKFVGFDDHLSTLKNGSDDERFYGPRCAGEMAPMLAASTALIDVSDAPFPENALATLSTGRPVLTLGKNHSKLNYSEGFNRFGNFEEMGEWIKQHLGNKFNDKALQWHKSVQPFGEIAFRAKLKSLLEQKNILN
ncbi:MAG: hypothetical protein Fur0010_06710 [Bdellovibrio sp.]